MLRARLSFRPDGAARVSGAANMSPTIFAMLRIDENITVVSGLGYSGSLQYLKAWKRNFWNSTAWEKFDNEPTKCTEAIGLPVSSLCSQKMEATTAAMEHTTVNHWRFSIFCTRSMNFKNIKVSLMLMPRTAPKMHWCRKCVAKYMREIAVATRIITKTVRAKYRSTRRYSMHFKTINFSVAISITYRKLAAIIMCPLGNPGDVSQVLSVW